MAVKILAPAKINLVLRIISKRPDNYHELYTIFQKVTLFDELEIQWRDDDRIILEVSGERVPSDENNLCVRAALAYQKRSGKKFGLQLGLHKRIPVGAGLGGGSSDAAAVLLFLERSFRALGKQILFELGKSLGADVCFFLSPYSTALGRGIGEELSPWPTHPAWYVILCPALFISTSWAYQNLRLTTPAEPPNYEPGQPLWEQGLVNDFEALIFEFYPALKELKEELLGHGARAALLSGSGASLFGVFEEKVAAQKALEFFRKKGQKAFLVTNYIPEEGGKCLSTT